jgi:hypothetical protein
MQGDMLVPRASKRTVNPLFRISRLRASKLAESDSGGVIVVTLAAGDVLISRKASKASGRARGVFGELPRL